jgi:ABC-type polysaccharide/polyol phosphate transport system ATPase subunit
LLKVLSRITEPTKGRITLEGRVASLLEVGTGFHPELTGKENIFLNGAILGMSRKEIQRKFDEIVTFAEIEQFLDTPVKRYSSGMYVRLAFAVAAHLEPEILIVDEVLAVGDSLFQNKCLDKMEQVSKQGRTVLFVSHNMAAINELCGYCVLLDKGAIKTIGKTNEVISQYLEGTERDASENVSVYIEDKCQPFTWNVNDEVSICIDNKNVDNNLIIDITFYAENRMRVFSIEGSKLGKPLKIGNGRRIKIVNPGIVNTYLMVDVGLKRLAMDNYIYLEKNVLGIRTEPLSTSSPLSGMLLPKIFVCDEQVN